MRLGTGGGVRGWRLALTSSLTAFRLLLIPVFILVAQAAAAAEPDDRMAFRLAAIGCLLGVGASDVLDGYLARRLGTLSRLGAIADAAIDKAVQISLLAYFTLQESDAFWSLPTWFLGLVIGRDLVLLGGGAILALLGRSVPVEHSTLGRAGTVLIFVLLLALTLDAPTRWLQALVGGTASLVVISTVLYVRRALRVAPESGSS